VSHDNGEIASVTVNSQPATILSQAYGVADWEVTLNTGANEAVIASATDAAGNAEQLPHRWTHP
jgi:hypothetical protein